MKRSRNSDCKPFIGRLATPIPVKFTGDDDIDRVAIFTAAAMARAKLPELASHYGIDIDSPEAFLDLMSPLTWKMALDSVPGFQISPTRRSGRKLGKTQQYYFALALSYRAFCEEHAEQITRQAFAEDFAKRSKTDPRQIMNDLSLAGRNTHLLDLAGFVARRILDGHTASAVGEMVTDITADPLPCFHKNE